MDIWTFDELFKRYFIFYSASHGKRNSSFHFTEGGIAIYCSAHCKIIHLCLTLERITFFFLKVLSCVWNCFMGNYKFYHKYYLKQLHIGEVVAYLNSVVITMRDSSRPSWKCVSDSLRLKKLIIIQTLKFSFTFILHGKSCPILTIFPLVVL